MLIRWQSATQTRSASWRGWLHKARRRIPCCHRLYNLEMLLQRSQHLRVRHIRPVMQPPRILLRYRKKEKILLQIYRRINRHLHQPIRQTSSPTKRPATSLTHTKASKSSLKWLSAVSPCRETEVPSSRAYSTIEEQQSRSTATNEQRTSSTVTKAGRRNESSWNFSWK